MARVSTRENKNIYQLTRENLKLTRETASELLESIPPERIEKIENERSFPHPDEVLTMATDQKGLNVIGLDATFAEKQIEPFVGGHITASFLQIL